MHSLDTIYPRYLHLFWDFVRNPPVLPDFGAARSSRRSWFADDTQAWNLLRDVLNKR